MRRFDNFFHKNLVNDLCAEATEVFDSNEELLDFVVVCDCDANVAASKASAELESIPLTSSEV